MVDQRAAGQSPAFGIVHSREIHHVWGRDQGGLETHSDEQDTETEQIEAELILAACPADEHTCQEIRQTDDHLIDQRNAGGPGLSGQASSDLLPRPCESETSHDANRWVR